jgi:hypothetical protein
MASRKTPKPWYDKYLRRYIRQIWGWSPERKAVKKRAQVSKLPEAFKCEKCGAHPLKKGEYEVNHIKPCEDVRGWDEGDKWNGFIERTITPGVDGIELVCKPCHKKITNDQNKLRRAYKNGKI